jgi:pyruvate/2-oxoglutarate dehydrogenase complex dihydrolipoamide acyltransferase (E2) component
MATVTEFRMPSLGADMDSGVLLEWLVHPGDTVHKGDIIAVVDTSKAAVEVECFTNGVIGQLLVEPGTRVPVGEALATIEVEAGGAPGPPPPPAEPAGAGRPGTEAQIAGPGGQPAIAAGLASPLVRRLAEQLHVDTAGITGTGAGGRITHADIRRSAERRPPGARVKASPMARRLAGELGVDLEAVRASGPGGAVSADDVRRAGAGAAQGQPSTRPRGIDTAAMRATIAALMARSKREIPHYYLTEQIDLGPALAWLQEQNRALPVPQRIVAATLLLKAAARAAAEVRELNGFWIDDAFAAQGAVHLGVAIALRGGGLVAPAIHRADTLSLPDLMAALRDLVARTRAGRLRGSELADPTITVSNLGDQGVESILGVIYPPQVALVGFGRIIDRPWSVGGLIGIRPIVTASLAADHRATDGATGARYLQTIARLLQRPEEL